jgi:hypothetical protein
LPPLLFFQNNQGKNGDVVEQNNNFSSLMNRQFEFLVSIFFGWKRERASWRARRDFSTKEKEEMGEVDKNHLRMEKKKKEGRSSSQRERERETLPTPRVSPQVLVAAGGALEPIRPTSVHKSGRTHHHLYLFFPFPLFLILSLSLFIVFFVFLVVFTV